MGKLKTGALGTVVVVILAIAANFIIDSSKGVAWISSQGDVTTNTKSTNIEMYGYNGRSYEWVCKYNPAYMCGAIATSEGVGAYSYPLPSEQTK